VQDAAGLREAARGLGARAERSVVIDARPEGITAARDGGFSLVIGVGSSKRAADLLERGADAVVDDLADIEVRTGDRRMSEIPNALESYRTVAAVIDDHRPAVCLDYDGTLSAIVPDPDSARLVGGVRFWERREVKDVVAYLRFCFNPRDSLSFSRIVSVRLHQDALVPVGERSA